jgi:hypothetical protein
MNAIFRITVALLILPLCLSGQIADSPLQANARIYVYRPAPYYKFRTMPIYMDEMLVAEMTKGSYVTFTVSPGIHHFRCKTRLEAIEIDMKPGQEYYLQTKFWFTATHNYWGVIQVTHEQAKTDMILLKLVDPKHVAPYLRDGNPGHQAGSH